MTARLVQLLKNARECIEEYHDLLVAMQTDKEMLYDYSGLLQMIDDAIEDAEQSNANNP